MPFDAANDNFDGVTDLALVDPSQVSLALGESVRVTYDLEILVDYSDEAALEELQRQTFETQIVANGTDPVSGHTISDLSQDVSGLSLEEP